MGCVNSHTDINDLHPNVFHVINIDDRGQVLSSGKLEITETELILHQKQREPTKWPFRCLRKYGFDSEIFSFESGRRCQTGAGIYAFRCNRAEILFNLLQQNIHCRNFVDDNHINPINDFSILPVSTAGSTVLRRRSSFQPEGYLNPTPTSTTVRPHPVLSRPGSLTSNDPVSPPAVSPTTPSEINFERNNNSKRDSLILEHSYTNAVAIFEEVVPPPYMNIAPENQTDNARVYMNVNCENVNLEVPQVETKEADTRLESDRLYENIDAADIESLKPLSSITEHGSVPPTPTSLTVAFQEVNYAELDLVPGKTNTPDSPTVKKSYVTIDFNKTNALSQSVNPRIDVDDGSRKTRHNSTINDMPNRHSNSLSD